MIAQSYRDIARRTGARLALFAERNGSTNLITKTQGTDE
jgi:ATP-binding protein involved in chromosome partitioning